MPGTEKVRNLSDLLEKLVKTIPNALDYLYPRNNEKDYVYPRNSMNYTKIITDDIDSNPIDPDKDFSFEEYSKAIVHIIKGSQPKFSIGIYGEWGSGKTTLMRLIEQKLKPPVFRWKEIPSNEVENETLKHYLKRNFKLNWIDDQKFIKSSDDKTIKISNTGSSKEVVSITLNKSVKATLKINDKSSYEFLVDGNKDNLSVRENSILTVWFNAWRYESENEFALIPLMKTIAFAMGQHPIYEDTKPILLRGLAILGKDVLRHYATQYIMTQKGVEEFEKNFINKLEHSVEFDKDVIYYDGIKKIEDKMQEILKFPT